MRGSKISHFATHNDKSL